MFTPNNISKKEMAISILSGMIVAFLIFIYLRVIIKDNEPVEILIAQESLLTYEPIIKEGDFKTIFIKRKLRPQSAVLKKEAIIGKTLIYPILKNEILTEKYIIKKDVPTQLSKIIPPGSYGFLLPRAWVTSSLDKIKTNDYVDAFSLDPQISDKLIKNKKVHFVESDGHQVESIFLTLSETEIALLAILKEKGIPISIVNNSAIKNSDIFK